MQCSTGKARLTVTFRLRIKASRSYELKSRSHPSQPSLSTITNRPTRTPRSWSPEQRTWRHPRRLHFPLLVLHIPRLSFRPRLPRRYQSSLSSSARTSPTDGVVHTPATSACGICDPRHYSTKVRSSRSRAALCLGPTAYSWPPRRPSVTKIPRRYRSSAWCWTGCGG